MWHGGQDRGTGHAGVSGRQEDRTEKQIRLWEQVCLGPDLKKFARIYDSPLSLALWSLPDRQLCIFCTVFAVIFS
jgi:hypothetical protein